MNLFFRFLLVKMFVLVPLFTGNKIGIFNQTFAGGLRGVDVSHHQDRIEWETVLSNSALSFVFVKATEGSDFTDSLFCYNWEELARWGLKRGAYHFFRGYGCGMEQAVHFLQTVDMRVGDLPPVLDLETLDGIPEQYVVEEALIWLQMVEQIVGIRPIVYTNQRFYDRFLAKTPLRNYPLWIARYAEEIPLLSDGNQWSFWQYSCSGCVEGISKEVDLNYFGGGEQELEEMCWRPSLPVSVP